METLLRRTLLTLLVLVFAGVVFHAPLTVWTGTLWPDAVLAIKAWKELLLGLAGLVVVVQITRHRQWRQLAGSWPLRLSLVFALIHLALVPVMWQGVGPTLHGLAIDLRFVGFFAVVLASLALYPAWRRPLLRAGLVAAVLSLVFAVLQVTVLPRDILAHIGYDKDTTIAPYQTVDQNYDYVRINGTLRGPNPLGAYAAVVLAVAVSALVVLRPSLARRKVLVGVLLGLLAAMALVALWCSYSRGALGAGVVAVGIILVVVAFRRAPRMTIAMVATAVLLMGGIVALAWDTPAVRNIVMHENPDEGNPINSNEEHIASLETGLARLVAQPLGAGVGSTGSASLEGESPIIIENYLLYVAHEVGWLGLAVFVLLYVVVMLGLWRRRRDYLALGVLASGVGLGLVSLLLPVWADDTVALVWWGLAAIALAVHPSEVERSAV